MRVYTYGLLASFSWCVQATCHAPDRTACFAQIFKCLKPGGVFAG